MNVSRISLFIVFFLLQGCASFNSPLWTGNYGDSKSIPASELEDSSFAAEGGGGGLFSFLFNPEEDFPVVSGDTGKTRPTMKEIKRRTPPTPYQRRENRYVRTLEDELYELESRLPEREYDHYMRYTHSLKTTSERIYFLRLSTLRERDEYLHARGLLGQDAYKPEVAEAVRNHDLLTGMSKQEVQESWGSPVRVDVAGDPAYQNERWLYRRYGTLQYVYFEGGRVQGWTQADSYGYHY